MSSGGGSSPSGHYLFGWSRDLAGTFKISSVGFSFLGFARLYKAIDNQFMIYNPVPTGVLHQNTYITQFLGRRLPQRWRAGYALAKMVTRIDRLADAYAAWPLENQTAPYCNR